METLEQLKEIVKSAPEGGHKDLEIFYSNTANGNYILFFEDDFYLWDDYWVKYSYKDGYWMLAGMRSLSDIKLIIELMEANKEAKKGALLSLKEAIEPDGLINSEAALKTIRTIQNAIDKIVSHL